MTQEAAVDHIEDAADVLAAAMLALAECEQEALVRDATCFVGTEDA